MDVIWSLARRAGARRLLADTFALVLLLVSIFAIVWFVLGAMVEAGT